MKQNTPVRIAEAHLPMIMFLIEYHRQQLLEMTKSPRYTKSRFLLDAHGMRICTGKKYHDLCNGKLSDNYEIYHLLLKNLNTCYYYLPSLIALLNELHSCMFLAAEQQKKAKLVDLANQAVRLLKPYRTSVYYREMEKIYLLIAHYHENLSVDPADIHLFYDIKAYIDPLLKPILLEIGCYYFSMVAYSQTHYMNLLHDAQQLEMNSIVLDLLKCTALIRKNEHLKAIAKLEALLPVLKRQNAEYYLAKVYNMLSISYHYFNKTSSIEYLHKSIILLEKQKQYHLLATPFYNMAVTHTEMGNYKKAFSAFQRSIQYDKRKAIIGLPFLYRCLEYEPSLRYDHDLTKLLVDAKPYYDQVVPCVQLVYDFYEAKANHQYEKITEELLPRFYRYQNEIKYNAFYFSIVFDHLSQICIRCNKQKYFYKLYEKVMNT